MRIGAREIGDRPYVIAEIGVNHDGDVARALSLTRGAHAAGADAVKLQLFSTDLLLGAEAKLAAYQRAAGETDPVAMLRRLELSVEQMSDVVALTHELGLHAIVTVFSTELVDSAARLPWDAFKVASPDLINRPLLDSLMKTGLPLIVSTGGADLAEVLRAREWLAPAGDRLAFMQCVSSYPAAPEDAFVHGVRELAASLDEPIGYSDHTSEEDTGALAVGLGAVLLEKHLTYDRSAAGPDHAASLEPEGLARYVGLLSATPVIDADDSRIGAGAKRVLACERAVREVARQSVTVRRTMQPGDRIARADLTIQRPGTGIEPYRLDELIGRSLVHAVACGHALRWEDVG